MQNHIVELEFHRRSRLMAAKLIYSRTLGSRKAGSIVFILGVILFLCSSYILAADAVRNKSSGVNVPATVRTSKRTKNTSGLPRYRVFSLRHISAEEGKKYLAGVKIGTVSQLPGPNALLVTAQRRELIKASAILKLVDAKEPFVIKSILPASGAENMPSKEEISAEVGNISIGTFSEPPALAAKSKAIIDIHNGAVIAIAPAGELEKIVTAIEQLQERKAKALRPAKSDKPVEPNQIGELKTEPALRASPRLMVGSEAELNRIAASGSAGIGGKDKTGGSESDEVFDKLFGSLAEAEKRMAEQAKQVETEPNEPSTVVIVRGPNEPSTVVIIREPNEPKESSVSPEQPKEADLLVAILERLNALEAAVKRGPEPQREMQPREKQVTKPVSPIDRLKIERPDKKVVEPVSKIRPEEPGPVADGNEVLSVDLPEKINIIQLLDLVSKFLGYDYMYDPADVAGLKGEVTITIRTIKVKHLYSLLESVLKFKNFVMTRKDNLLIVVPVAKAIDIDPPVRPEEAKLEIGDIIITRVFELKDIDTSSAQTLLTGMKLGVSVTPIPEAKKLIITGYAYRMARIKELLEMIDEPGEPKQFKSRELEYTMANVLVPKVKTLADQLGTVSITIGASTATKAPPTSAPRPGETSAQRRAREAREAAARSAAARTAASRAAAIGPAAAKPAVYLDADDRTNRILMIGLAEQLAIVEELIDSLDVQKQDLRTMRLYEIQYVDAEEVMNKLGELGIIGGGQVGARTPGSRITPRTVTPATKTGRTAVTPSLRTGTTQEALVEEPQVVIIGTTNSLLVNATAEQHTQIAMIISYVDSETEEPSMPYVVYPLENQDPLELSEVLTKLIMETTTTQGAGKDAKIVKTTTKRLEEDIYIVPDAKTYSLIVYASKKNQQWISKLIQELDEYRPQVLLDVTLVEITKNDEFNYNLNILSSFPDLVHTSGAVSGTILEGLQSSKIIEDLDTYNMDRFIDLKSSSGTGTAFYGDRHINLLLDLVQKKNYGRILAKPKLLVNDNEQGTITAEETTYVVRTESSIVPGTTTGTSTTVEKTIFEDYSAGITLDITPHISKGANLRLIISLIRSDFRITQETIDLGKPPDTVTSDVSTTVTVPDGTTIILGGLERLSQSKGGSKVPLLGDIPLIGGLFRSTANTDSQSRLYVFVKAHILRPGEEAAGASDIEVVSAKNRATFEKYEKEMQDYEDWPGIKPKPMDPVKILEADEESDGQ
jgi:type II secretory pathway component GspD/PulD (secretin)